MSSDRLTEIISLFHWCFAPIRLEVGDFFRKMLNHIIRYWRMKEQKIQKEEKLEKRETRFYSW